MVKKSGLVGMVVTALPILELITFFVLGARLGFLLTFVLSVALFFLGSWLFRYRLAAVANATASSLVGQDHSDGSKVSSGLLALVGAGLLILPGFITGSMGLLLQFKPVRTLVLPRLTGNIGSMVGSVGHRFTPRGDVIDVDVVPNPDSRPRPSTSSPELL
ncbi:MAG: FxsA family protein [Acidimicrobiales bacterium]|nr:FxsA family protein [Acidimicrobiales bacterium]